MTKPINVKNLILGEGLPKICAPLVCAEEEGILKEAKKAVEAGVDLVEWRADFFAELLMPEKVREVLQKLIDILGQIPVIFTVRTAEEGGNIQITTEDYVNCNLCAAESGFLDFADVQIMNEKEEMFRLVAAIQKKGVKVIASSHDFEKTDDRDTLLQRFKEMDESGADILKMAVMPQKFDDVVAIMQTTSTMRNEYTEKPLISMAMGNLGSISRIAGENFGSCLTFATVGAASAPGQFPVQELRMMMNALHEKNME